ncbi:hypothetical protein JCM11491_001308 [Sporobolomyces phaffii]
MAGFFTKIAHSPHVNLGDFKQLHEVLTSEKRSIDSVQKLSADQLRASNAIRDWGYTEGDDLGDVLAKVSQLYDYLAQAEMAYAEHSVQYRLKFKEIRTMEENLASLRRSRDQQGGKIEAQERKVSKMKEEHKDLPSAKQRLRELRDEMVGLENSVMTEDTRLGDFKRSAIREGLSLKLGALLELSEKTTVIAELGKLMVDELPTQRTQPGSLRAHYDGYDRTNYLLQEAQRCLQGVTFNPAPISEPYGTDGTDSATQHGQQHSDEPAVRSADHSHEEPVNPQSHQYGSMASFQTPASSAFAQQGSATDSPYQNSPRTSTSASYTGMPAYSNDHSTNNGLANSTASNAPLTLASPQLNPLPDFQRLSFSGGATPRAEEPNSISASQLAPPVGSRSPVVPDTPVSGYTSNTPALAPPRDGWGTNRTSLAYLGEAPSSDGGHGDIEAREAQQAFEDEARAKDSDLGHERGPGEFGAAPEPSRSYNNNGGGGTLKRDEGLATISEAMLEASPPVSQPATFPIPSPDVPSDVQPQSSIDSSLHESTPTTTEPQPPQSQPREYQPLLDSAAPPPPAQPSAQGVSIPVTRIASPVPRAASPSVSAPTPVPLPIPSPLHAPTPPSPSIAQFAPSSSSGFEPRPITPRSASGTPRQPISIRPQAGTSLGSKHGDIVVQGPVPTAQFVPAASSPNLRGGGMGGGNGVYGDSTPASSGYFTPTGTTGGGTTPTIDGKRTISAGAFRRPPGAGGVAGGIPSSVGGINVNGGRSFAPSGYNVVPIPGNPGFGPGPDAGPSDAEQIAQSWRSTAVPVAPGQDGYGAGPEDVPTPSFDTRPLQVNKNRMSMGGLGRPGTVPPTLSNLGHARSSSHPNPPSPGFRPSSEDPRNYYEAGSNVSQAAPSYHSFAPPHPPQPVPSPGPRTPASPTGSAGFGSNRFVTRLD